VSGKASHADSAAPGGAATGRPRVPEGATRPVAAVFDLDRTVTKRATYIPFLLSVARRRPVKLLYAGAIVLAGLAYKLGLISRGRVKEFMLRTIVGKATRAEVADLAESFVAACLGHGLRPGARRALAEHRARGDNLILATASFDFYVERLGRQLGFDAVIATRAAWDQSGRLLGRIDGENCYGAEKLRRLEEALPELRGRYRVIAYSDSHADLPLLLWAERGVAVNPSRRLRRHARSGGLDIVDWNEVARPGPHPVSESGAGRC
jgi:HAD superfamily hydrolase (TIGR01490 family)